MAKPKQIQPPINPETGKRIQKARKAAGLTQEELANKLFVTKQAVKHWEHGRSRIAWENLERVSEVLNVSIVWLQAKTTCDLVKESQDILDSFNPDGYDKNLDLICASALKMFHIDPGDIKDQEHFRQFMNESLSNLISEYFKETNKP